MSVATVNNQYCSVGDAAEIIGCTDGRVRQLLRASQLGGVKLSERAWAVDIADAKRYAATEQKTGGPRGPRS